MYTLPLDDTATAGKKVSTGCEAGALSVPPLGCVTGYPIGVRVELAKASCGVVQVTPPLADLLQ